MRFLFFNKDLIEYFIFLRINKEKLFIFKFELV
jgi:hypothetical protein